MRYSRLAVFLFSVVSFSAVAAPAENFDVAASLGALVLVIALILFLAWLLKKMRFPLMSGQADLSVVRQLPIGAKERVMIIQAGEQQYLIGVTAQSIQLISQLDKPVVVNKHTPSTSASISFAQQLSQVIKRNDK